MKAANELNLIAGRGVEGDRYANGAGHLSEVLDQWSLSELRQVSFFERETLDALRRDYAVDLTAGEHRRNVTTCGAPLNHLIGRRFRVGETILEGSTFPPCKHLGDVIGQQVAHLLQNRAGLYGRIIRPGTVRIGDRIEPL